VLRKIEATRVLRLISRSTLYFLGFRSPVGAGCSPLALGRAGQFGEFSGLFLFRFLRQLCFTFQFTGALYVVSWKTNFLVGLIVIQQTLFVVLIFGAMALSRRQAGSALGVVILSMMLWPEYLRIPLGIAEMSAPRIIGLVLLVQSFSKGIHRNIRFQNVDVLVLCIWGWTIFATIVAGSEKSQITQMIGRGLDTVLMYFLARVLIRGPRDVRDLFFWLAMTAIVMGVVGGIESVSSRSPYSSMTDYRVWQSIEKEDEYRLGFLRAKASTSTHIYFGMAMTVILGMLWACSGFTRSRLIFRVGITAALVGVLSSMSSGPWMGCILVFVLYGFAARVSWIRPATYGILLLALLMELISNRHFYNLIDYLALDPHTAWYRTRLLEVAFSNWRDFWIIGVGSNWPQHWADLVDGRDHIDVVNNFLIVALYGGIPATLMYVSTHVIGIRLAAKSWRETADNRRRNLVFGLSATLIALDIASMSVGLFGPVLLLSNILLGVLISSAVAWSDNQTEDVDPWTQVAMNENRPHAQSILPIRQEENDK
jgi:hypothetical protein